MDIDFCYLESQHFSWPVSCSLAPVEATKPTNACGPAVTQRRASSDCWRLKRSRDWRERCVVTLLVAAIEFQQGI